MAIEALQPVPDGPVYIYRAQCQRVVDGDTFVAHVDLGFDVFRTIYVRIRGVNSPEHNKPGGPEATKYLEDLLLAAPILIKSYRDEQSFARWICDVWVGNADLATLIIASGHGVAFDPKKDKWVR
jgi:micrococcal nuclease